VQQIHVLIPIPKVCTDLPAVGRQVGIEGWRPIISADCSPVAILELTIEDAALLLIASENFQIKLKRYRSGGHEINLSRGQYRVYHSTFPLLKAEWKWGFQYFRIDFETFAHIWGENLTLFFLRK